MFNPRKTTPFGMASARRIRKLRNHVKRFMRARRAYMLGDSRQLELLQAWAERPSTPQRSLLIRIMEATQAWIERRDEAEHKEARRLEALRTNRPVKYAIEMIDAEDQYHLSALAHS